MAWAPSTNFEEELVDYEPDNNFILGQLAYVEQRRQENAPRPQSTYDYLAKREKLNEEIDNQHGVVSKEIQAQLAMMERIQQISGTKPLGEHATMKDWEDTSTVETEIIAMMRHFNMNELVDGELSAPKPEFMPQGKIHIIRNGRRTFPLILDPSYFEPRRTRKPSKPNLDTSKSSEKAETSITTLDTNGSTSSDSVYVSAKSQLDDSNSDTDAVEIPYELLQESVEDPKPQPPPQATKKGKKKKNFSRPSQRSRHEMAAKN